MVLVLLVLNNRNNKMLITLKLAGADDVMKQEQVSTDLFVLGKITEMYCCFFFQHPFIKTERYAGIQNTSHETLI